MSENNEINSLINQAKSEARGEVLFKFIAKNKKNFVVASAVVAVGVVGLLSYNFYQKTQQKKFSEIFHQSLIDQQLGDLNKAKEGLKKIHESSAPDGIHSLASLRYANILFDENNKAEAAKVYQKISQCGGCDAYVKDLGGLLAVKTWLSDESEIQKEDLLTRIEKIESHSTELRYQISEQKAAFYVQKNNLAKAYEVLEAISKNPEAPQNIKTRVTDSLKMIIAKGYDPSAGAAPIEKVN